MTAKKQSLLNKGVIINVSGALLTSSKTLTHTHPHPPKKHTPIPPWKHPHYSIVSNLNSCVCVCTCTSQFGLLREGSSDGTDNGSWQTRYSRGGVSTIVAVYGDKFGPLSWQLAKSVCVCEMLSHGTQYNGCISLDSPRVASLAKSGGVCVWVRDLCSGRHWSGCLCACVMTQGGGEALRMLWVVRGLWVTDWLSEFRWSLDETRSGSAVILHSYSLAVAPSSVQL